MGTGPTWPNTQRVFPQLPDLTLALPDSIPARWVGSPGETAINAATQTGPARPLPQVAGYEVLGILGQGGMSIVYRAGRRR